MAHSNEGITGNLLEMLQNAESFEVWSLNPELHEDKSNFESVYIDFQANEVNRNFNNEYWKNLISVLLKDIEKGGEPSRCWIPHHGIRAVYNDQLIEIALCFECGWFRGEIQGKKFWGTFPDEEESESKIFFDKIIAEINYAA